MVMECISIPSSLLFKLTCPTALWPVCWSRNETILHLAQYNTKTGPGTTNSWYRHQNLPIPTWAAWLTKWHHSEWATPGAAIVQWELRGLTVPELHTLWFMLSTNTGSEFWDGGGFLVGEMLWMLHHRLYSPGLQQTCALVYYTVCAYLKDPKC